MKIFQFKINDGQTRVGVLRGDDLIDLNASDNTVPHSLVELIAQDNALEKIESIVANPKQVLHKLANVQLLSPITRPDKVLGLAYNFKDACDKINKPYPVEPIAFNKFASTIVGPYDPVEKPSASEAVAWEVELVVVIGKKAKDVQAENAFDYVFGYTGTQDLTAVDWAGRNGGQFLLYKNMDNFCPLGPCVVTKDELGDPHNIQVKTWVNGVLKQDGNTEEFVYGVDKVIEYLSHALTLLPGDVILTGTPPGVGANQNPPQYLQKGDLLESEVEKVGRMANRII